MTYRTWKGRCAICHDVGDACVHCHGVLIDCDACLNEGVIIWKQASFLA